jgi:hypothetical protein
MADVVSVSAVNFEEIRQGLSESADWSYRLLKDEFGRHGKRFRKQFIKTSLRGRPGIKWDERTRKIGGNVRANVEGKDLRSLQLEARLSRFLRVHEEGAIIQATVGVLALRLQKGLPPDPRKLSGTFIVPGMNVIGRDGPTGLALLYGLRTQVKIPARLKFVATWQAMLPTLLGKIPSIVARAIKVSIERRAKAVARMISNLAAAA